MGQPGRGQLVATPVRQVGHRGHTVGHQKPLGGAPDLVGRHPLERRVLAVQIADAGQRLRLCQRRRPSVHRFHLPRPSRQQQGARAIEIGHGRPVVGQPTDHQPDLFEHRSDPLRLQLGGDPEDTDLGRGIVVGRYRRHQSGLPQGPVEPAAPARGQDRRRKVERGRRGIERRYGGPAKRQLRAGDIASQRSGAHLPMDRFLGRAVLLPGARLPLTIRAAPQLQCLVGIDRADDRDDGPGRDIPGPIVPPDVLATEPGKLLGVPDAPAADPVPVEHQLVERLVGNRVRRVELPAGLLNDHLKLPLQLVPVDHRVPQRIRLNVERLAEPRRREYDIVGGVVVAGSGIEIAAGRLGLARDLPHAAARRSLEVHVLQNVRDPLPAIGLVEEAGFDMGDDGDSGRGIVPLDQEGEPVGKHFPPDTRGPG